MLTDPGFELHPRLAEDTLPLGETRLNLIRLMNNRTWPWLLLVPRRPSVREIYQLSEADQQQLLRESSALGQALMEAFSGDKLNLGALGNMVPQLHLHHIVRHQGDPAWPGPVWGHPASGPYSESGLVEVRQALEPVLAAVTALDTGAQRDD